MQYSLTVIAEVLYRHHHHQSFRCQVAHRVSTSFLHSCQSCHVLNFTILNSIISPPPPLTISTSNSYPLDLLFNFFVSFESLRLQGWAVLYTYNGGVLHLEKSNKPECLEPFINRNVYKLRILYQNTAFQNVAFKCTSHVCFPANSEAASYE